MIKYDKRIDALITESCGEVLADIGCDHGYVAVGAVLSGKVKRAVAIDISEKSLEKTRLLSEQTGVADKVRCLCGNGFAPLDEDVDVAVIAGMGGVEIISVLEAAGDKLPARLVLCPHQNAYELRRWLNGRFRIVKDRTVAVANKYYPIIVPEKGSDFYGEDEFFYGKNSPAGDDYAAMLKARRRVLEERFSIHGMHDGKICEEYKEVIAQCSKLKI